MRLALYSMSILVLLGCASKPGPSLNKQLIRAAEIGDATIVLDLILRGADPSYQDAQGWNAYLQASTNGHLEAMEVLRSFNCSIEPKGY